MAVIHAHPPLIARGAAQVAVVAQGSQLLMSQVVALQLWWILLSVLSAVSTSAVIAVRSPDLPASVDPFCERLQGEVSIASIAVFHTSNLPVQQKGAFRPPCYDIVTKSFNEFD